MAEIWKKFCVNNVMTSHFSNAIDVHTSRTSIYLLLYSQCRWSWTDVSILRSDFLMGWLTHQLMCYMTNDPGKINDPFGSVPIPLALSLILPMFLKRWLQIAESTIKLLSYSGTQRMLERLSCWIEETAQWINVLSFLLPCFTTHHHWLSMIKWSTAQYLMLRQQTMTPKVGLSFGHRSWTKSMKISNSTPATRSLYTSRAMRVNMTKIHRQNGLIPIHLIP